MRPEAEFPVMAKPSGASGSKGVIKVDTYNELQEFLGQANNKLENWVIQEFLWVATLILTADKNYEVRAKRTKVIEEIKRSCRQNFHNFL